MLNNYICALDIGSSKIAAALAETRKKNVNNIFFETIPVKGVKKGVIVDPIELVESLTQLLKNLKAASGIKIKLVYANILAGDIITKHSRAILPLAERGNKVITSSDIHKAHEQARLLGASLEEEIIHQIPSGYVVDAKTNVSNPLGLYGHRLETDLYLICARLSGVQTLNRVLNQSGYEIKDLFFTGLATARAVFNKELKEGLNLFCDIGSDTAELLVFRDGTLVDLEILSVGGDDLTRQLQDTLKVPFELAEDIKRSYGIIGASKEIKEDKEILIKKTDLYKPIKQRLVSEVITEAAKPICSGIKEAAARKASLYEVNNFIITGRTVLLEGFIETLENAMGIPVKLGRIMNPGISSSIKENSVLSGRKYLTYLTALGMVYEALEERTADMPPGCQAGQNPFFEFINKFKEIYQEYF